MNLPRLTADQSLVSRPNAAASGRPASPDGDWPAGAGLNGISMMITYVSPQYKSKIMSGENPCPSSQVACWGTGNHSKGYICCDPRLCGQDASGRPDCDLPATTKTAILSGIPGLPPEVINLIVQ